MSPQQDLDKQGGPPFQRTYMGRTLGWVERPAPPVYNIQDFGGSPDNFEPCDGPWNAALAAISLSAGGRIHFPPGTYKFNTQPTFSYPSGVFSLAVTGDGQDVSILTWPNANGGLAFNLSNAAHTIHVRDLTFTTSQAGGGSALTISNTVSLGNFPESDITDVTFIGSDRALTNWWTTAISATALSGLNITRVSMFGQAAGASGTGISLLGTAAPLELIVPNIIGCNFFSVGTGIAIGTQVQGVTVDQCNFTNGTTGIQVNAGGANLVQLDVASSQFNVLGNGVNLLSAMA